MDRILHDIELVRIERREAERSYDHNDEEDGGQDHHGNGGGVLPVNLNNNWGHHDGIKPRGVWGGCNALNTTFDPCGGAHRLVCLEVCDDTFVHFDRQVHHELHRGVQQH